MKPRSRNLATVWPCILCAALLVLSLNGCPPVQQSGKLTVLLTAGQPAGAKNESIPADSIAHLYLDITEVLLTRETENGPVEVRVFLGEVQVDLANLDGVAEVITASDVPRGIYTGVTLRIANPQLVLAAAPDAVIADVLLPEDGLLTVPADFQVETSGEGLLVLDLGAINLYSWDDGSYSFTPSLAAALEVTPRMAQAVGRIDDAQPDQTRFRVRSGDASLRVQYQTAAIFVPGDFDSPTGTNADIENGARAFVFGPLGPDGGLIASLVIILHRPEAAEGEGEGEGEHEGPSGHEAARELLGHLASADANNDGELSLEEAQTVLPALTEGQFADLDTDSSGGLSTLELLLASRRPHEAYFALNHVEPNEGPAAGGNAVLLRGVFPEDVPLAVFFGERRAEFNSAAETPRTAETLRVIAPPRGNEKNAKVPVRVFLANQEGDALLGTNPVPYYYQGESEPETAERTGLVSDLGIEGGTAFRLVSENQRILVLLNEVERVFLPEDNDAAHGSLEDLAEGARVRVIGIWHNESIAAHTIRILEFPATEGEGEGEGEPQTAERTGTISKAGLENGTAFRLQMDSGSLAVWTPEIGEVFLPGDGGVAHGSLADLVIGARVRVNGVWQGENIVAYVVHIIDFPPPGDGVIGVISDFGLEEGHAFRLQREGAAQLVRFAEDVKIYLRGHEEPTGTKADLGNNMVVRVAGPIEAEVRSARSIWIL